MAILFWLISVPCAGIANLLAFRIFARLKEAGIERRWWRHEDFRLYRLYWKLAPTRGWPRQTLIAAACFFGVGGAAMLVAVILYWGK
jgi:hypothetical protein